MEAEGVLVRIKRDIKDRQFPNELYTLTVADYQYEITALTYELVGIKRRRICDQVVDSSLVIQKLEFEASSIEQIERALEDRSREVIE